MQADNLSFSNQKSSNCQPELIDTSQPNIIGNLEDEEPEDNGDGNPDEGQGQRTFEMGGMTMSLGA